MAHTSRLSFATLIVCLIPAGMAAQDPTRSESAGRPPIRAANAARVHQVGEIPRDVYRIVWGPGHGRISLLSWEMPVDVLDAETFKPVRQIAPAGRLIQFVTSADGKLVAWSGNSNVADVHDLASAKTLSVETRSKQSALAFSPDGKWLATGGYGTDVKLWRTDTGELLQSFDGGPNGALTPVFSPDGRVLAVGNRNSVTRLFDPATGKLLRVLPKVMSQELRFNPDGSILAVGYVDGSVALWNPANGELLRSRASGGKEVYTLDWTPAGDLLATAGLEGKITLWDPRTLTALKEIDGPEWVIQVRFSPDGTRLLTAGGTTLRSPNRKVTVWSVPEDGTR